MSAVVDRVAEDLARAAWRALTGEDLPPGTVSSTGTAGLPAPLPVAGLAVGAVATHLLAAGRLYGERRHRPVRLDAVSFRSERYVRPAGHPVGRGFAPLSRFLRTADGWIRLHANYPNHRAAVLVLGPEPETAAVEARAEDPEAAVVDAGGAAAAVRSRQGWAGTAQGRAVAASPLLALRRVAEGPCRRVELESMRVLDLTRVIAGPECVAGFRRPVGGRVRAGRTHLTTRTTEPPQRRSASAPGRPDRHLGARGEGVCGLPPTSRAPGCRLVIAWVERCAPGRRRLRGPRPGDQPPGVRPTLPCMRAVQITRFGGPEVMDIVDLPDPTPGEGQKLHEVSSAGVNFADTHHRLSVN